MRDDLLDYYENELTFLRQMGKEFAEKHPKIAARLQLDVNRMSTIRTWRGSSRVLPFSPRAFT